MAPKKRSRGNARSNKQNLSEVEDGEGGSGKKSESQNSRSSSLEKPAYTNWLMKSEPESRVENGVDVKFGIEDLKACPNQTSCWDGVRNYQITSMSLMFQIVKEAYVDHTQFDKKDVHYDPSSKPENPKWSMVDVQFERMTRRFIPLTELKKYHLKHKGSGGALSNTALFTRARLSVQPLTAEEFDFVLSLEDTDPL
ncbi:thymocyte nuclear protein 1 isoform X2 [Silurus meridionalis]|uniref:thymocyte nuclear protein 1 isoform X2 n=1 Tax=Silurus meridionalis TaxID=175797 RepID=UPI001EEC2C40|nr:thymocyte nuclear protein 1 isoform X2 [Silurus meridionalis]